MNNVYDSEVNRRTLSLGKLDLISFIAPLACIRSPSEPSLIINMFNFVIFYVAARDIYDSKLQIAIIFLCTTYDSSSYILATAAMKNFKDEPSRNLRLFFALL